MHLERYCGIAAQLATTLPAIVLAACTIMDWSPALFSIWKGCILSSPAACRDTSASEGMRAMLAHPQQAAFVHNLLQRRSISEVSPFAQLCVEEGSADLPPERGAPPSPGPPPPYPIRRGGSQFMARVAHSRIPKPISINLAITLISL